LFKKWQEENGKKSTAIKENKSQIQAFKYQH
jgi:hypothetical protein